MSKLLRMIPWFSSDQKNAEQSDRKVAANDPVFNLQFKYKGNYVKTSKYNFLTFLPLNLLLQFRKIANLYFLLQIVIMSIKEISSLNPASTAVPLAIVLLFTMFKDGYDDYGRHKSDAKLNNQKVHVLNCDGKFEVRVWQKVETGDIIKICDDEPVAADILLLSTSEENGVCFIETAELDGETNLKVRNALVETDEVLEDEKELSSFKGVVTCELPNNVLDKFQGNLDWKDNKYSLDNNNVVLRGCVLRNTQCVYGLVIFAGHDSKLMMNSGQGVFKRSKLDKMTNDLVLWIALMLAILCTFLSIMSYVWEDDTGRKFQFILPWISLYDNNPGLIALINWPGFVMVLNTLIPISLYISVEFIRFGQSKLIDWDLNLYHPETDAPAQARNTTLTEELGQIQYIFSDKTGTLTQNVMMFKECSINGRLYGHPPDVVDSPTNDLSSVEDVNLVPVDFISGNKYADPNFKFYDKKLKESIENCDPDTEEFFTLLALCHTVMVEQKELVDETDYVPGSSGSSPLIEYQAQSPDEGALVSAATNFGYVFKSRNQNSITIIRNGEEITYQLLCILDFDNVRKRMSVIVRRGDEYILYCKGADTTIYELLNADSEELKDSTQSHLDAFACEGLRTLCLASKRLTEEEFDRWMKTYQEASVALDNRDEKMFEVYCDVEKELTLLGATAIEDKLQDGVPDAIANLAEANIKIWVLTGDKQETAINIGYSSMLLTENMVDVFIIDGTDANTVRSQIDQYTQKIRTYTQQLAQSEGNDHRVSFSQNNRKTSVEVDLKSDDNTDANGKEGFALVISGKSLAYALLTHIELDFLELGKACKAVICCRVTPLQKALVVELVKRNVHATTLAIGDGANDVSMIKAAHIGVGISGREGRQAVLASDYSFAQFRFLERLLLVHGRWSYMRMAKFLNYFFYKNFAFTLVQFWYSFFNGYSAQTLYDTWFMSVYNVCFTSLPVLAMGIFDQDVSDKTSLSYPKLYIPGQTGILFNRMTFARKLLHGIVTSCLLFFIPYGVYRDLIDSDGLSQSNLAFFAVVVGAILVIVVNLQMALDTSHWTWINHFFIWGSIVFYFLYTFTLYSETLFTVSISSFPNVGSAVNTFGSGSFWAALFLTSVVCLTPVMAFRWMRQKLYPTLTDTIRRGTWKEKRTKSSLLFPRRTRRSLRSRPGSHRSGYAFSQQAGLGDLIMSKRWLPKMRFKTKSFDVTVPVGDSNT